MERKMRLTKLIYFKFSNYCTKNSRMSVLVKHSNNSEEYAVKELTQSQMIDLYFIIKGIMKRNSLFRRIFSLRRFVFNYQLERFNTDILGYGFAVAETKGCLKIGCQKISYRKIRKLLKLMEKNF